MPSLIHNIVLAVVRAELIPNAMKIALEKDFVFRRPPTDKYVQKFDVSTELFRDYPVYSYGRPLDGQPLLYFCHGGGFLAGMFKAYFDTLGPLSKSLNYPMIVPDYPMPREVTALQMREWVLAHFKKTRSQYPNSDIIVGGDSAGANMALALAQDLGSSAKADIAQLYLLYGWYDLTRAESDYPQNKEEVLLRSDGIVLATDRFRGDLSAEDPRISPLFGSLTDLPPIHMISADKDMLYAESQALEAALIENQQTVSHFTYKNYAHDFWLLPSPDGRKALRAMARELNKATA